MKTTFFAALATLVAIPMAFADQASELFSQLDKNRDKQVDASEVPDEHARLFERLVRKADKSGDGRLSPEEFAAGLEPSVKPKPIYQQPSQSRPGANELRLLLLKLDTNRDAYITRDEAPQGLKSAFSQLAETMDKNKDGEIAYRELQQNARQAMRTAQRITNRAGWNVEEELKALRREQGEAADRFDRRPDPRAILGNPQRLESLFRRLDANSNGQLVLDELPEEFRKQLARLVRRADRDRSQSVSLKEFQAVGRQFGLLVRVYDRLQPSAAGKPSKKPSSERMMSESMDSNEKLSTKTGRDSRKAKKAKARSGSDGQRVAAQLIRRMVKRMDKNSDGAISKREATGQLAKRFDKVDQNADGRLDASELRREAQRLQSRLDKADAKRGK